MPAPAAAADRLVPGSSDPLTGKALLLLPYSHMDWAWCFTRAWHEARYIAIFDEALRLAAADPSFCLFVDSLAECVEPYFARRPEAREPWNRLVEAGRIAVVGGQYVNLRPSTAPEEMFLRNLEIGRRVLADLLPAAKPCGYANLDTAIGHSQLPQFLALAGLRYMLVGRSEGGLAQDGVPAIFLWEQQTDGDPLLVLVQHYGICTSAFQRLDSPDADVRAKALAEFREKLRHQAALGLDLAYAMIGADDIRYLHDPVTDRPYDLPAIRRELASTWTSSPVMVTPDELVRRILPQAGTLQRRRGMVDQADVAYNGPFGQCGLRELRDRTAAALVEAELYDSLAAAYGADREPPNAANFLAAPSAADGQVGRGCRQTLSLSKGQYPTPGASSARDRQSPRAAKQNGEVSSIEEPPPDLDGAWRRALRGQTHATQYLFAADVDAIRLDLTESLRQAEAAREAAFGRLAPCCLPQDSDTVAILNPLPWERTCLVPITVYRTDFSVPGFRLADERGTPIPQQALQPPNEYRAGEWDILVHLTLPPCGFRILKRVPDPARAARRPEALDLTSSVQAGPCRITWRDGWLVQVEGSAFALESTPSVSILEPLRYPTQVRGWMTTALDAPTERAKVLSLHQCEWGPLRWGFERVLACGPHRLRQWLRVDAEARLDVTTEIAYGPDTCTFTLAVPCSAGAQLLASIPFGVEPRMAEPDSAARNGTTRPIERLLPGVFYARDWVSVSTPAQTLALAVLEGDRYWLCRAGEDRLEHILMRATEPISEGWEQFTQMNRPGFMRFRHALLAGTSASPEALSRLTDGDRFPVRCRDVRAAAAPDGLSLARLDSDQVRLIAWRRLGDEMELRLVESAGRRAAVVLHCARTVHGARLVNLLGAALPEPVDLRPPGEMGFALQPWQIATLRFRLGTKA